MLYALQDLTAWSSDAAFLADMAAKPYGLLQVASCFLTQFFYYPWLGIIMLTAIWGVSAILTQRALRLPSFAHWTIVAPVFSLLVSLTQQGYWIYLIKIPACWYLFSLLWLWWAVMLIILFSPLRIILRILLAVAWLCVLTPWHGLYICPLNTIDEFMYLPHYVLLCILLLQLVMKGFSRLALAQRLTAVAGIIPLAAMVVWSTMLNYRNACFHAEMRLSRYMEQGNWQAVISEMDDFQRLPTRQMVLMRDIAMLHTHQLQTAQQTMSCEGYRPEMLHGPKVYMAYTGGPLAYYAAGFVNDAYRWTYENCMEKGFAPGRLRLLLLCALQNHEWRLADKYVAILRRTLFHRAYADAMAPLIGHPERFASHPALCDVGRIKQTHESTTSSNMVMEPRLFIDPYTPLKAHADYHLRLREPPHFY